MAGGKKILAGLKEALNYARCPHEFTYWQPRESDHGWTRICTKCKTRETRLTITDEIRRQT